MIPSTKPSLRFHVIGCALAALLSASHAQTTITYVDGEDKTDPIVLDVANSPVSLSIDAGAATQSGVISEADGPFGITKIGAGMLTLAAENTYTGSTILDGGTLRYTVSNPGVQGLFFGASAGSTNVSALDLSGASLSATGLTVRTASASANTITIGSGRSLDIAGATTIGVGDQSTPTILEVSGEGSLNITGGNFILAPNNASTADSVTVNLSGLSHFTYNDAAAQFRVAGGIPNNTGNRSNGTLTLANTTNTITAAAAIIGGGSSSSGGTATLNLGAGTNVINADTVNIGFNKHTSTVRWLPETTTGTLKIRGTGGTDADRATITIGSRFNSGSAVGPDNVDLNGHEVDILAGALTVGRVDQLSGSATTETANLSFDFGVIDATSLMVGNRSGAVGTAIGNVTVGSTGATTALLKVGTGGFTLTNGASAGTTATLNVNAGGTVETASIIAEGAGSTGTSNVNFNGGTLKAGLSSTTFMQGLNNVRLQAGGVTVDTNGFDITIGQALAHDPALGVAPDGGLKKTGAGNLTLSGANTYTGNTVIEAGTLGISSAFLDDSSSVLITSGALFSLEFTGFDTINMLFFDGAAQSIGTWGSSASGAEFVNDSFFSGTGMLSITAVPEPGTMLTGIACGLTILLLRRRTGVRRRIGDPS
jgi:autotransporter-associated beta strand protein